MSEREQFEALMRERGEDYLYRRDSPFSTRLGEYCRQNVQDQWEVWQASRRAALEEIAARFDLIASNGLPITPEFVARQVRALADGDKNNG